MNALPARSSHLIEQFHRGGHCPVERSVHLLGMIRPERPSVKTVLDQLFHSLTVETAKNRKPCCERFIHHNAPFIGKRGKHKDAALSVKFGQFLVRHATEESELKLTRCRECFEFRAQGPLPGNPEFTSLVGVILKPARQDPQKRRNTLKLNKLSNVEEPPRHVRFPLQRQFKMRRNLCAVRKSEDSLTWHAEAQQVPYSTGAVHKYRISHT